MYFYYIFTKGSDWIKLSGSGSDPIKCDNVKFSCNKGNKEIGIVNNLEAEYHPVYKGVMNYKDNENNLLVQVNKFGSLIKYGYRHNKNNFPEIKKVIPISKSEKTIHIKSHKTKVGFVKAHERKITFEGKEPEKKVIIKKPEEPNKEWVEWQQYYKDKLFRPSVSPHEDYYSQSILVATSPQHAKALIRRYQAKDPSSMGVDLAADFERLYNQTKDQVPKKSSLDVDNLTEINPLEDSGINIVGGVHEEDTYICKFKDGSSAIHKVMMAGDIAGEVGTYEISKIADWDVVPETIQRNYGRGEGSTQKWIKDGEEPIGDFYGGVTLGEKHLNDLSKIFILDMINGNFDRHEGNLIIDKQDHVWAIDNECIGNRKNAKFHIEGLEQFAKEGAGSYLPIFGILENNFGDDPKMYQKFKDHVDKNIDIILTKKDEIIKYWNQYDKDMKVFYSAIPMKDAIKFIKENIEYLENYRGKL